MRLNALLSFAQSCGVLCLVLALSPLHAATASVFIEELSTTEVRDAVAAGRRTVIIPVGGTEQNGPHMALGKHNFRVGVLAGRIAEQLGTALVAPVLAYVPEGRVSPPTEHMRHAGTISIPEDAFKAVLTGAALSFAQHGFTDIVLIGDSGNYQTALRDVAAKLNLQWQGGPARAHFIAEYYAAGQRPFVEKLLKAGLTAAQIGTHAGAADTALMLAVDPRRVWPEKVVSNAPGVSGDPRRASAELGALGADSMVQHSVAAIRRVLAFPR